jgi:HEAT repeat protein
MAAGLARQEDPTGLTFIRGCLEDEYPQHRLEAVIVLNEIATDAANQLLVETLLNDTQHPEVRAGAAWALGELRSKTAMSALIDSFVAVNDNIRIEAARALAKLATLFTPEIVQQLSQTSPAKRPGIAWALSKSQKFALEDLLDILVDEDTRHWVAYIIGTQHQERFLHEIERVKLQDPEVYFAITVLWKIMTSWVYGLEEY